MNEPGRGEAGFSCRLKGKRLSVTRSPPTEIVVIGASAGGVEALRSLLSLLPGSSPAAYVVVIHIGEGAGAIALPTVLSARSAMPVGYAVDGADIEAGQIILAPPGVHTIITDRDVRLLRGPRENGHRPAVDTLFRSAAAAWDGRATGVILSGTLDDGAAGLAAIAAGGGRTFVQDPDDALYASMPLNAIARVAVDKVLPVDALGQVLADQAITRIGDPPNGREAMSGTELHEPAGEQQLPGDIEGGAKTADRLDAIGENANLTCPGCGGALWEIETDGVTVLRCHVGHAYGLESFEFEHSLALESALWTAVRTLEEKHILLSRLGEEARDEGRDLSATSFLSRARGLQRQAIALRELAESVMTAESGSDGERSVPA